MRMKTCLILVLLPFLNVSNAAKGSIAADAIGIEYASNVIGEGETEFVTLRYATTQTRKASVELFKGTQKMVGATADLPAGRGNKKFSITMPASLVNASDYRWVMTLGNATMTGNALDQKEITGVIANNVPQGSGSIAPNHAYLVYEGRVDLTNPTIPEFIWPGNNVTARFQGTSISVDVEAGGSDPQWHGAALGVLIDGDSATYRKIELVPGTRKTIVLASGLSNKNHSIKLYRDAETVFPIKLRGFTLDAGKGLLQPRDVPSLKLQFYGNSVTCGGSADPTKPTNLNPASDAGWGGSIFTNFAGILNNTIPSQHIITCKGGAGVSNGFIPYYAKDFINNWHFNIWNPSSTITSSWEPKNSTWDNAKYRADVVIIEFGQNDGDNAGFIPAYKNLLSMIRTAHPTADIVGVAGFMPWGCANGSRIETSVKEMNDSKMHYLYTGCTGSNGGSHPKPDDHAAAIYGNPGIKKFLYDSILPDPIPGSTPVLSSSLNLHSSNSALSSIAQSSSVPSSSSIPGSSSSAVFGAASIANATSSIVIDGVVEILWDAIAENTLTKSLVGALPSASDLSGYWKALWDSQALYLLVKVTDQTLVADNPAASWNDDGVEIYLDGGNQKATSYDSDDLMFRIRYSDPVLWELHAKTNGVVASQATFTGGYVTEIKIPWEALGGSGTSGRQIGLDVHVNDNDATTRESKLAWFATEDNSWQKPSIFGTAVLKQENPTVIHAREWSRIPLQIHMNGRRFDLRGRLVR